MTAAKKPPEGGTKHNLTIRFSTDELQWLNEISAKEFRPVAGMVRYILAQYRKEQEANTHDS